MQSIMMVLHLVSAVLRTVKCRITADIRHITHTPLIMMENIRMMIAAAMIHIITIITTTVHITITQICLCSRIRIWVQTQDILCLTAEQIPMSRRISRVQIKYSDYRRKKKINVSGRCMSFLFMSN